MKKKSHDDLIISQIKLISKLIAKKLNKENQRFWNWHSKNLLDSLGYLREGERIKNIHYKGERRGDNQAFYFPIDKYEKDGIQTEFIEKVIVTHFLKDEISEKKFMELKDEIKHLFRFERILPGKTLLTGYGRPVRLSFSYGISRPMLITYFLLRIVDKNRTIEIPGGSGSTLLTTSKPYSINPSLTMILKEAPLRDTKPRLPKYGMKKSKGGPTKLLYYLEDEPKPRWLGVDPSYKPIDYFIQIAICSIQKGLLSKPDFILKDFGEYVFSRFKDTDLTDKSVRPVGYYDERETEGEDTHYKISYNAPKPKKSPWRIDLREIDKDILRKALEYIIKGYRPRPTNPTSFEVYVRKTIAGTLKTKTGNRSYRYERKINPEREIRKEIIKLISEGWTIKEKKNDSGRWAINKKYIGKKVSKETARKRLQRWLKKWTLDEIMTTLF
ncbi:MAG: hypothetical protein COZ69_11030 [Deltaproteobacteria bacterium CG_4_8_14_3_um_filter_45_9]|nr:MAG: hypothetical protein COS40_14030 [Deltaproteobacteria bacterium CG03_land_8_20_14_0_80_45_14]PIX22472.1 MAG: hypothetical protein COZ69_11030 [Deltaproteobacteria bacterium CG_4_8_14_3_um_filter_45_9]